MKPYRAFCVFVCLNLFGLVCLSLVGCGAGTLGPGVSHGGTPTPPPPPPPPSLVTIVVTPANPDVLLGSLEQFTATAEYSDGSSKDITSSVTWTSSDITVASIAGGGMATALALGSVTISGTLGTVSGSTSLNVQPAVLASIAVKPVNKKIAPFTSQQFQAIGTYTDGSVHNVTADVTWSSSNTGVATVGRGGRANALAPGSTTITATLDSISGSGTLNVSNATIVSVIVTPTGRTIAPDTKLTFAAHGVFSDRTNQIITVDCTWASDNPAVAVIKAGSTATAIGPGTANISATFQGVTGSAPLNVSAATLSSITVTPGSAVLAPTTTVHLTATGTYSDGTTQVITDLVTWISSAPGDASVNTGGVVTGESAGNATITAQLSELSGNSAIFVDGSGLTSIAISPQTSSIPQQTELGFTATGTFADGKTQDLTTSVLWTSSPASVATISNVTATAGEATGLASGTATITALFGGQLGTATLTVTSATATALRVSPAAVNLERSDLTQLRVLAEFSDATTRDVTRSVSWTSFDESVAEVSATGVATSNGSGTTTVTATRNDLSGTAVVVVY